MPLREVSALEMEGIEASHCSSLCPWRPSVCEALYSAMWQLNQPCLAVLPRQPGISAIQQWLLFLLLERFHQSSVAFSQNPCASIFPGCRKGNPCTCWTQQGAPPWHLTHQPKPPFLGLACGGLALTMFRAGHLLGLACASRFGHWPMTDSWLP